MYPKVSESRIRLGLAAFIAAAVFGIVHAGFSLFWAGGGTWLLWSLGSSLLETFQGMEWVLHLVGLAKLIAAVAPLVMLRRGWWKARLTRAACWAGALVLITWGGLNTVIGNLVLTGVIQPSSGFDRPGMIGHAWLWDPLFLVWGASLVVGIFATEPGPAQA